VPQRETAVLLLSCRDQKGLVAAVSDFIYRREGNILSSEQHADLGSGVFFQRLEFDLAGLTLERERIADEFAPLARRFGMTWDLRFTDQVTPVAILVSRLDHCLHDLLWRWRAGELPAEVRLVLSNHPHLADTARAFGVAFEAREVTARTRGDWEEWAEGHLRTHGIGMLVLARYMQVLSPEMVARWPRRIVNIHHSFLPAFAGGRPYHQAHERGVKIIGATAHYVTEELDQGPIIEQDVTRVSHRDTVEDLVRKGRDLEKLVLARAVSAHLRHRVLVYGNRTVVFD